MVPRSKAETFARTDQRKKLGEKLPYCNSVSIIVCVNLFNANGLVLSSVLISLDFKGLSLLKCTMHITAKI